MYGWLTTEELADLWPDAPEDGMLSLLNVTAIAQLEAYAPGASNPSAPLPLGAGGDGEDGYGGYDVAEEIPSSWKLAQLMQVRSLFNASRVDSGGSYGDAEFAYTPHPLDWQVKAILRPKRGRPAVG